MEDIEMFDAFEPVGENDHKPQIVNKISKSYEDSENDKSLKRSRDLLSLANSDQINELKAKVSKLPGNQIDSHIKNEVDKINVEPLAMPKNPAKVYPFKLDTFQLEAINYIEKGRSYIIYIYLLLCVQLLINPSSFF